MALRVRLDGIEVEADTPEEAARIVKIFRESSSKPVQSQTPVADQAASLIFGKHSVAISSALRAQSDGLTTSALADVLHVKPRMISSLFAEWKRAAEKMGVDLDILITRRRGSFRGKQTSWYQLSGEGRRLFG